MRKMKKFLCAVLTTTMVLAMAAPSFAAEASTADTKGTITIDNPMNNEQASYTAYKIFDVTYSGEGQYAYSIPANSPWFDVLITEVAEGETEFSQMESKVMGLSFTKAASEDVYYVTIGDNFGAAGFAQYLKRALDEMSSKPEGTELTNSVDGVAATELELGYYFVTTPSGALCNLTTTNPDIVIHDKNEAPTIEKEAKVDEGSVQIGDKIPYTITGKVTNLDGYDEYKYIVSDTMSDGLTLLNSGEDKIKVTIDGEEITPSREDLVFNEHSFTLTMDLIELGASFNDEIIVTYYALVNESAANGIDPVTNTAKLTYSNDPATDTTADAPEQEVELYTSNLIIDKYLTNDAEHKLEGAKFVLQNNQDKYYQYVEATETTSATVNWVDDVKDATEVTTDKNGYAEFKGLKDGTYYLVETEAPAGYNLLAERVEVFVNGIKEEITTGTDGATGATVGGYALTTTQAVENSTGAILPGTGGIGTTIFYAAGIILMAGAVFFVVRRKRA